MNITREKIAAWREEMKGAMHSALWEYCPKDEFGALLVAVEDLLTENHTLKNERDALSKKNIDLHNDLQTLVEESDEVLVCTAMSSLRVDILTGKRTATPTREDIRALTKFCEERFNRAAARLKDKDFDIDEHFKKGS